MLKKRQRKQLWCQLIQRFWATILAVVSGLQTKITHQIKQYYWQRQRRIERQRPQFSILKLDRPVRLFLSWLSGSFFGNEVRSHPQQQLKTRRTRILRFPNIHSTRPRRFWRFLTTAITVFVFTINFSGITLWLSSPAFAAAQLSITPISWNFVGLDSNNVNVGPNTYMAGARVCNIGDMTATNVKATFVRDGAVNPYINLQASNVLSIASLPAGAPPPSQYKINYTPTNCTDFYYNIVVTRTAAAYNTTQRFHIEATADGLGIVSTPSPRELYVEKILSQARNTVLSWTGPTTVYKGQVYQYTTTAKTATAYPQLTFLADFPNTVFQLLSAKTTYSLPAGGINSTIHADGCGWVNDPTSPDYHRSATTCNLPDNYTDGKAGNDVTTVYTVKILSTGRASVSNLIYDFSGGSYHYNADYGTGLNNITITSLEPQPSDLTLTKTHTGNFTVGQNGSYTLTVKNNGPATANGPITVTDTLPTGLTYVSATGTGWTCSASSQTVTCTNPNSLSAGASFSPITLTAAVGVGAASNSNNTATVSSSNPDSNTSNNTVTDPTTIIPSADLKLIKSHTGNFTVGQNGTYTLTVTNSGPSGAVGPITINDTLPTGLSFVSGTGTDWTCSASGQNVTCTNPNTLASGASSTLTLTVGVSAATAASITNTATVSSATSDSNITNNTANDPTTVNQLPPDLSITKSHVGTFAKDTNNEYTLTVTNTGQGSTTGAITVSDTLPSGMSYVSVSGSGWSFSSQSGQTVTFTNPGPLAPGVSSTFTLTVKPTSTGTFTNTATVTTSGDTNSANNTANDSTVVATGNVDFSISKTHSPATVSVGQQITYTILVNNKTTNASGGVSTGIPVTDIIPTAISNVTWLCTPTISPSGQGSTSCGANSGTGNINTTVNLPRGGQVKFTLTGTVNAAGTLSNTATVGTPSGSADSVPSDNTSTDTTTIAGTSTTTGTDLQLTKTHSGSFAVGGNGDYTLTVKNVSSTATTQLITVTDTLPAQLTYVSAVPATGSTGWTCSASGQTVTCTNPNSLAAGASSAITLTVKATTATGSPFTNTATVATPGDNNSANNTANDPTAVAPPSADLSVVKSHTGNFNLGQSAAYTLTVSNSSSSNTAAGPITVKDVLPDGLSFLSGIGAGWICSASGQTVTCTNANGIAPGSSSSITLNVVVGSNAALSFTNTASVSSTVTDPTPGNNTANDPTLVNPSADLSITKSDTGSFIIGNNGTYILTVTNNGPSTAAGSVTVTDTLPSGLSYVATGSGGDGFSCSASGQTVTCINTSGLAVGASATIGLNVMVNAGTPASVTNTATVSSLTSDPNTTNNKSDRSTTVGRPNADLTLTKSHLGDFTIGEEGTYSLTVTNKGPTTATGTITITDTLPSGLSFSRFIGAGWNCTAAGQTVTCTNTNANGLAVNATSTVDLIVTVGSGTAASITNTASVSSANDSNNGNNTANDSTKVLAGADLSLTKTHTGDFPSGQNGTYTLTVTNAGPVAANGPITVTDTLPDGLGFVSATGTDWFCSASGQTVTCANDNGLAVGASSTFNLTVSVSATAATSITNTASVSSPTHEPTPGNNQASDKTNITIAGSSPPRLLLVKRITAINNVSFTEVIDEKTSADDDSSLNWPNSYLQGKLLVDKEYLDGTTTKYVSPGDEVEYTIYFLSDGKSIANNVTLCDLVPAHQTFVTTAYNSIPQTSGGLPNSYRGITASRTGVLNSYTNAADGDIGTFYAAGASMPITCSAENTNGAVVMKLGNIPQATGKGIPSESYGFIRFRAKVN